VNVTVPSACGWKAREWNSADGLPARGRNPACSGRLRRKGKQILLRRGAACPARGIAPRSAPGSPIRIRSVYSNVSPGDLGVSIAAHRKIYAAHTHHDQRLVFIEPAQPVPGLHDPDRST
jgi:hypothetical protein